MKQRKMTRKENKEHSEEISLITFGLIVLAVVIILAALIVSVGNRKSYLIELLNKSNETNNIIIQGSKMADSVDLKVASTVATTSGRVSLNVITDSSNPNTFKEYRYYIKESTNDMYVLDAIKVEEQHAYVKLEPNTSYDVKVEAVSHTGETMTSMASGATPTID